MLKPLGKNILVQRIKEEPKKGALILTASADDKPYQAVVIDKGSKVEIEVQKDDVLLMIPYSGSRISTDDDGYLLVTERDILGVVS